tara:strand:- start:1190 stop:1474 length:285 start_codon:yes stop_codon:yes gene_type:complete
MIDSFFNVQLGVSNYEIIAMNDFFRMFVLQFFSQFMYSQMNNVEFLSPEFIENTSYILLSILVYWFVFNRTVYFSSKDGDENYMSNLPQYLRIR